MAKATLSLAKKENKQGEHHILVRMDITRTNRPQFKSPVTVKEEEFVDGEISIPKRGKLNTAYRENLMKKKTDIEAFVASLNAIIMSLPEEALTRKDILEVYEMVKTVNPSEISRTTIISKKREQTEANAELVKKLQDARRPSLLEFVQKRIEGMENGSIKRKGNNYSKGTLHTYKGFAVILESFCKEHPFEWNDINERLIDEFVLYMERYGYMKKTINKNLAVFSAMLNVAFKEGYKFKASILEHFPKLQVNKEDMVVEIYLTNEELQALYDMELEGEDDRVRDVFLVGCYTSQRFSDYSRISAKNVTFHDGVGIITLVQQKTNTEVTIPILNDNLLRIFEKYNYNLPNIQNQRLNNRIKAILETLAETMPSLKHELPTKLTLDHQKKEQQSREIYKRNSQGEALIPRYKLATTHTARRTGITLMYLEKILDTYEMMSISGHKTESVFNDYIKISGIELATNIAKKVAKARKESEVKSLLLQQFESITAEQLANLLELSKNSATI